ncbi:MAG: NADPH quinone oxidoreductase [Sulfobacillus acidophilus]|uniref:NADPH quinone oxidoreductase n=1 Tax=Sulfobacillus acidophilus TaxID=53633 RepID=A0A2T2WCR8_9FIRM|nr:MAG: NADPH quinone oxidoreductase [Sulfobacillus acidophilus]
MKAVVLEEFGGPEVLTIREIPDPIAGPDEVRIRVSATALNRADLLERQGRYAMPGNKPRYQIPGLEVSGVVDQVGERVVAYRPGDRVMALLSGGGYAEYAVSPERLTMPVPVGIDIINAAAIPEAFLTAFDALFTQGGAGPGSRVLVHAGASGVGSAAIQLAHQFHMSVVTTVGSQIKLEAARAFGADHVVNYRHEPFADAVLDWSQGRGVDVILDLVGQSYFADNLRVLSHDGTLVVIGTLSGTATTLDLGIVLGNRLKIQGTTLRSRAVEKKMALIQRFLKEAWPLLDRGLIAPVIDSTYDLADIAEAHRYLVSNQNIGKVLVRVG